MNTVSRQIEKELITLISAKYPIIYVVSWEEDRVEDSLIRIAKQLGKTLYIWTLTNGITSSIPHADSTPTGTNDLVIGIDYAIKSNDNAIFVFEDLHPFLDNPLVIRKLRDLSKNIVRSKKSCLILSPILKIPAELEKEITVVDYPLPDIDYINSIFRNIIQTSQQNPDIKIKFENDIQKERILKAALGLTKTEIENVFAKALVKDKCLDVTNVDLILNEKKQIIRKSGILEYYDVEEKMDNVGGLENLKDWIYKRSKAFTQKAREFGLPEPKGILILGVQGCGKSLCVKAISSVWRLPLLRLDMGVIFGKYVGESEYNIRVCIKIAESIAPVILWIDELEKGFAGVKGSEDAGTTARVFGTFLTWMQEKSKPVFIAATANDISVLPPELLRKGRFDEIFFVDLPSKKERIEIFKIHLKKRGKDISYLDLEELAEKTEGYSGAEIEQIVISALYDAFDEERKICMEDLTINIEKCMPLSKTMREKIEWLKEWANGRAIKASR